MMKKTFKLYIIAWGLILAIFNLITFIIPTASGTEKFSGSFWIGYISIIVALIGQFVCSAIVFKHDEYKKAFYNITLLQSSFIGLVASFVIGIICMAIPGFPAWITTILCATVLALYSLAVIRVQFAVDAVTSIDDAIREKTYFIKNICIDAETLEASAKSDSVKADCKKVSEALRYSDPMSSDSLLSIEGEISLKFATFSEAVKIDDTEKVSELAKEVLILIGDRNRRCKLLK